jgi:hypothetical protein
MPISNLDPDSDPDPDENDQVAGQSRQHPYEKDPGGDFAILTLKIL